MKNGDATHRRRREREEARNRIAERKLVLGAQSQDCRCGEAFRYRPDVELALGADWISGLPGDCFLHEHDRISRNENDARKTAVGLRTHDCVEARNGLRRRWRRRDRQRDESEGSR
jgi:hypothetical protein